MDGDLIINLEGVTKFEAREQENPNMISPTPYAKKTGAREEQDLSPFERFFLGQDSGNNKQRSRETPGSPSNDGTEVSTDNEHMASAFGD